MTELDCLQFKDIALDAPHTKHLVEVTLKRAQAVSVDVRKIKDVVSSICDLQTALSTAYRSLSSTLCTTLQLDVPNGETFKQINFQFFSLIDELVELHQNLATDVRATLIERLQEYIIFLERLPSEHVELETCVKTRDQAYQSYMRLPKKSNVKSIQSASGELAVCRRNFNWMATQHYGHLNRACRLHEILPLITMKNFLDTQSQHAKNLSQLFGEPASTFLEVTENELQRQLLAEEQLVESFNNQVEQTKVKPLINFCPEPWIFTIPESAGDTIPDPVSHPNRKLLSKSGHLLFRNRVNLVWRWVEVFCSTQGGNLMSQQFDEIGASLLIDLNQKGVYVEETSQDDRRNVFQVVSPTEKKCIHLQAESQQERDEWIATLTNIIYDVNNLELRTTSSTSESAAAAVVPQTQPTDANIPQTELDWPSSCMPSVSFSLPPVACLNSARDSALLQIHRAAPLISPQDADKPIEAGGSKTEEVIIEDEDIPEPIELQFLGSIQLPPSFQTSDPQQFNDVLSYILSCRSASSISDPLPYLLLVTKCDVWIMAHDDETTGSVPSAKRSNVLLRIPFSEFRGWFICPGNSKLACLLFTGPLSENPTFANVDGQVCLAFESPHNQQISECLLAAHLARMDVLENSEDSPEKDSLMRTISRLSEAALSFQNSDAPVRTQPSTTQSDV